MSRWLSPPPRDEPPTPAMNRQMNANRLTLTGALMAATAIMVMINLSQPGAGSTLLNTALTLLVAGLIVFGLVMLNVLERRWDAQQDALQAAQARNSALISRMAQRAEQLTTLNQMSVLLTQTLSTSDVLDTIVSSSSLISQAEAVAVFVLRPRGFEMVRDAGFDAGAPLSLSPVTARHLTTMSPSVVQDIARDSRLSAQAPALRLQGFTALLELPFVANGRLLGVVVCYFRQAALLREDDISILLSFAALLANALQNAERYEQADQRREVAASHLQTVLDARETYTSMIVHDLRSPLTAVSTSLRLIADAVSPGQPQYELVQRLTGAGMRAVRKVLSRVDSLLDIARMESGFMNLQRTPTNIPTLVDSVIADLHPLADELNIRLEIHLAPLPLLMLDADKIERALLNLVDNALKHSPAHSTIRVEALRTDDHHLRLRVVDQGSGVPDAYKERLFDRFVQVEDRQVVRRGVGLGLSLCKAVADAHGGRIWIADNPGGGAIFTLDVPMQPAGLSEKTPTAS